MSRSASASSVPRPGFLRRRPLAVTVALLLTGLLALGAGLQLSYVPPPPATFTVAIRDGEILLPAEPALPPPAEAAALGRPPPGLALAPTANANAVDTPADPWPPAGISAMATTADLPAPTPLPPVARIPARPVPPPPPSAAADLPPLADHAPIAAPVLNIAPGARPPFPASDALAPRPFGAAPPLPALAKPPLQAPAAPPTPPPPAEGPRDRESLAALRLPPAPAPAVAVPGPTRAWTANARPFAARAGQGRIAIVLWGIGRSRDASAAAIRQLPGEVTLSLTPHGRSLQVWADQARAAGHEVILEVPMEPVSYPDVDPGADALLTSLPAAENRRRLERHLALFEGYVGITNFMGSRFTTSAQHLRPVLELVKARGLIFLDSRASSDTIAFGLAGEIGLDRAINNRYIDNQASRDAIDRRLAELESVARRQRTAVGIGFPYLVTIERLGEWIPTLAGKGLQLAPLSAVIEPGGGG